MGQYKNCEWYIRLRDESLSKYGDVPPPWVFAPEYHPHCLGWRMGGGETHLSVLNEWHDEEKMNFKKRLAYLQKYPCAPRWYVWHVNFLWENISCTKDEYNQLLPKYFEKLTAYGFKDVDEYWDDINKEDE